MLCWEGFWACSGVSGKECCNGLMMSVVTIIWEVAAYVQYAWISAAYKVILVWVSLHFLVRTWEVQLQRRKIWLWGLNRDGLMNGMIILTCLSIISLAIMVHINSNQLSPLWRETIKKPHNVTSSQKSMPRKCKTCSKWHIFYANFRERFVCAMPASPLEKPQYCPLRNEWKPSILLALFY